MSRPLTAELIRVRTKSDNISYVKKFTLCGHDIDDVKILRQMPNIEVLSLSVNKIDTLREFSSCSHLQELYVRKNEISDISEVRYLMNLKHLKTLWLSENPCSEVPYYREYIIYHLPQLAILDKSQITHEERAAAAQMAGSFEDQEEDPREVQREVQREAPREQYSPPKRNSNNAQYEEAPRPGSRYGTPGNGNYGGRNNDVGPSGYGEVNDHQQNNYGNEPVHRESYRNGPSPSKEYRSNAPHVRPSTASGHNSVKNENVITAVLMLLKDLDEYGLRIVKKDIEKKLGY